MISISLKFICNFYKTIGQKTEKFYSKCISRCLGSDLF